MDDIVKAALKKWPNVPHCFGWLALDARGDWYMRDDRIQHAGPFPAVKGSRILHDKLRDFIERNIDHDEAGCWFFQNGPQRVYLELEAAPWVLRVLDARVHTHTGAVVTVASTWTDENGRLFADTDQGYGIVHTQDMLDASQALDSGQWPQPGMLPFADMPGRFGYRLSPQRDIGTH